MNRFRFSIGSFLVVVTLLALGMGAIVSQSELAGTLAYTYFVSLLCLAAAVATGPPTARRAFCVGFAIFGATYWFTEFSESSPPTPVTWPAISRISAQRQSDPVAPPRTCRPRRTSTKSNGWTARRCNGLPPARSRPTPAIRWSRGMH